MIAICPNLADISRFLKATPEATLVLRALS
jgi:hypothetical protein